MGGLRLADELRAIAARTGIVVGSPPSTDIQRL
jgi:hypothetical protein